MSVALPPVPPPSSEDAAERGTFLRACSRKSLESNPEDEELIVGTVQDVPDEEDDRTHMQAAEYALSLLEVNEELQRQVTSLKIQLESNTADLPTERNLYRRRHEHALLDIESWKRKHVWR
ncbi:hypothetical protein PINS_up007009 [Pythium insidiosum]|nr:hypothetical protein PINS_up007009 [Pythium insidiosum]